MIINKHHYNGKDYVGLEFFRVFKFQALRACSFMREITQYMNIMLLWWWWGYINVKLIKKTFIIFTGSYFCYDNPAALQDTMIKDLSLSESQFMLLYSLYSWPNVILCFFGGFLIDRVFGVRMGSIIFSLFVTAGQVRSWLILCDWGQTFWYVCKVKEIILLDN